jgi:hypothetical protein
MVYKQYFSIEYVEARGNKGVFMAGQSGAYNTAAAACTDILFTLHRMQLQLPSAGNKDKVSACFLLVMHFLLLLARLEHSSAVLC